MELTTETKFELCHTDTCLPDYFSGDSRPHIQIPVWRNMTLDQIKEGLHTEIHIGAVGGSELDWEQLESDLWYEKAKEAIDALEPNNKEKTLFFTDLDEVSEEDEDNYDTVYAYFVFVEC